MPSAQSFQPTVYETVLALHPASEVGSVSLKVADLQRALDFYTQTIGLWPLRQDEHTALLGAGDRPILHLESVAGAQRQPNNTTGLYHAAILFPDRHSLAIKVSQLSAIHYPLGYSDHLVSEAFYLSDPDGNGLELYRDRPRSQWKWAEGRVQMATDAIDFRDFFDEIKGEDPLAASPRVPDGTKLGHMHLRVADIGEAEKFYHGVLGLDVTAQLPSALFLSAGGYHHHIGMNTWESRRGKPPVEPSAGLREFSLVLPDLAELDRLTRQIEAAGVPLAEREANSALVLDPCQNRIRLTLAKDLH
jgi:catechol 2,3-dioxygenase